MTLVMGRDISCNGVSLLRVLAGNAVAMGGGFLFLKLFVFFLHCCGVGFSILATGDFSSDWGVTGGT
jgi:hypothetical protein